MADEIMSTMTSAYISSVKVLFTHFPHDYYYHYFNWAIEGFNNLPVASQEECDFTV